jgi:carboxymethylenebutenolidase
MPVAGQVDDTDSLICEEITYSSDGDEIWAYVARPRSNGPAPGLIVIHEAFGVNAHIQDIARRFANVGFNVIAPDLFSRVGVPDTSDVPALLAKITGLPDRQIVRDLEGAARVLLTMDTSNGKVGAIGFCLGGRAALLFACASQEVDASVDCWGGSITQATPEELTTPSRPIPVIDRVPNLACPLYVVIGAEDPNPSPAMAEQLRARLKDAGKEQLAQIEIFENAGHAFFADYRDHYREGPAFELWPKLVAFLDGHLR